MSGPSWMRFSGSLAWPVWWMKNGISVQFSFIFIYYGWSWKLFCMFSGHFISLNCLFMCFFLDLKSTWLWRLQLLLFHCFYLPGKSLPKPLFLVFSIAFEVSVLYTAQSWVFTLCEPNWKSFNRQVRPIQFYDMTSLLSVFSCLL